MGFFSKGDDHGQHRKSATQIYGSSAASPSPSPGGAITAKTIYDALRAGTISSRNTYAYLSAMNQQAVAHSSMHSGAALGAGYAQQQMQAYMQAKHHALMCGPGGLQAATPAPPPHLPTSLKSEGIRAGEIIAWRAWYVSGEQLLSVIAAGKIWSPTEPMRGDPVAGYGVHAYKSPHGPMIDRYADPSMAQFWVIGEVALWGDIIEHEDGYRAEFARVHSLVTWARYVPDAEKKRISDKYLTAPAYKIEDAA